LRQLLRIILVGHGRPLVVTIWRFEREVAG
jgi:hypothetical protein